MATMIASDIPSATFQDLLAAPNAALWLSMRAAVIYYGGNHFARNVQLRGLQDAAQDWGIDFRVVYEGQEGAFLTVPPDLEHVILITSAHLLPRIRWWGDISCQVVLWGRYYNDSPDPALCPLISTEAIAELEQHREHLSLVLSEFSSEGNRRYMRGYMEDLGLPILAFPWGVNLFRHHPAEVAVQSDVLFAGSYFEKTQRFDAFFGPILSRHRHTVFGLGWSQSPFPGLSDGLLHDFEAAAPMLYSSHLVALNLHHPFELEGYSCNERTFNAIACGGFQICDSARRVRDFFGADEVPQASTPHEYADLVGHFVAHPEERLPYMQRARQRVFSEHTYHHRLRDLLLAVLDDTTASAHCQLLVP